MGQSGKVVTMRESPAFVRAWTIQPWSTWEQIQAQGSLTVAPHYVANLHHCYEWLRAQLPRHLTGYTGHYPWWAYCTRPDLRQRRHRYPAGERYALIELGLPQARVLSLTFWAWDLIFYGKYLAYTQEESQDWHRRLETAVPNEDDVPALPEHWLTELETSWQRLFAPDLPTQGWWTPYEPPVSACEVVFEVLDRTDIHRVTPFLGARLQATPH